MPLPFSVAENTAVAFFPLTGGNPLIRITRAILGAVADPRRVVVAAAEPLAGSVRDSLESHGLPPVSVVPVAGPAWRADCLSAALQHVERQRISTSHVLVHDISRPLITGDLQDRVIEGLRGGATVVMPALPLTDSVKAVDSHGSVTGTLDRSQLRAVQYPRGFDVAALARLLSRRGSEDFDELQEAIGAGMPITVVAGDADAFAAELPRDAQFVEAITGSRRPDPHGW